MDHLATNMAKITTFSASISDTLQDRRHQITKLAGVHTLLKKVCMIFVILLLFVGVCFLVNPFLALTTSYDVHGRVFSIQPERFHRVPCLNSDRSCVLRRSQVLESEHLWLDLPVCETLYGRNCISSTKSVARKWSDAGGTHTFDCGIKSERPMLTLMLLVVANLVILWTLYCTVNSMYMLFTGMWEHLV